MLHHSFNYVGASASDHIVVADDDSYQLTKTFAKERLEHTFKIGELDQSIIEVLEAASCVGIRGDTIATVPEWLPQCGRLKYLSLPVHLAGQLRTGLLPKSIETLNFEGVGRAQIPDDFVHSQVRRLMSDPDAIVDFNPLSFPSLEHFHFLSDKKKRHLMKLHKANLRLITATVSPFSKPEDLALLFENRLKYLWLAGGLTPTLNGLERFTQITDLQLHNLSRLESIEPVLKLDSLQDLSIGYCNRIQDLERLADLRSLKRLMFYGCGKVISDAHIKLFRAMKLDELVI